MRPITSSASSERRAVSGGLPSLYFTVWSLPAFLSFALVLNYGFAIAGLSFHYGIAFLQNVDFLSWWGPVYFVFLTDPLLGMCFHGNATPAVTSTQHQGFISLPDAAAEAATVCPIAFTLGTVYFLSHIGMAIYIQGGYATPGKEYLPYSGYAMFSDIKDLFDPDYRKAFWLSEKPHATGTLKNYAFPLLGRAPVVTEQELQKLPFRYMVVAHSGIREVVEQDVDHALEVEANYGLAEIRRATERGRRLKMRASIDDQHVRISMSVDHRSSAAKTMYFGNNMPGVLSSSNRRDRKDSSRARGRCCTRSSSSPASGSKDRRHPGSKRSGSFITSTHQGSRVDEEEPHSKRATASPRTSSGSSRNSCSEFISRLPPPLDVNMGRSSQGSRSSSRSKSCVGNNHTNTLEKNEAIDDRQQHALTSSCVSNSDRNTRSRPLTPFQQAKQLYDRICGGSAASWCGSGGCSVFASDNKDPSHSLRTALLNKQEDPTTADGSKTVPSPEEQGLRSYQVLHQEQQDSCEAILVSKNPDHVVEQKQVRKRKNASRDRKNSDVRRRYVEHQPLEIVTNVEMTPKMDLLLGKLTLLGCLGRGKYCDKNSTRQLQLAFEQLRIEFLKSRRICIKQEDELTSQIGES
ncbi:unnamed protein product [Amoebophrya sp. A25]|nr:unnamed protein product [Amoebophrya sp. A25]|eukprot:GSA25T00018949001.1